MKIMNIFANKTPLNSRYTFDNYIISNANRGAIDAIFSAIFYGNSKKAYNPVFVYGPNGIGKTHLLQAIANKFKKDKPKLRFIYTTVESFINNLIVAINNGCVQEFRNFYQKADVLLIDDIHFLKGKQSTELELVCVLQNLYRTNKQIILSADRHPEDIFAKIQGGLIDFLSEGLTLQIRSPFANKQDFRQLESKLIRLRFESGQVSFT